MDIDKLFGPIIYAYPRRRALKDGVLVDLSTPYPQDTRIFKYPVACTSAVWDLLDGESEEGEDLGPLVWDLCWMATKNVVARVDESTVLFEVIIRGRHHTLKAICGPSDDTSPCITILLRSED